MNASIFFECESELFFAKILAGTKDGICKGGRIGKGGGTPTQDYGNVIFFVSFFFLTRGFE